MGIPFEPVQVASPIYDVRGEPGSMALDWSYLKPVVLPWWFTESQPIIVEATDGPAQSG